MAAPLLNPREHSERWQALKDYLTQQIDQDLKVADACEGDELRTTGSTHYALVSANRSTLAKMRELEQS